MSLGDRWAADSVSFRIDMKTGEQFMMDPHTGRITPLTPESIHWDHRHDELYYKHHPDKRPKE